MNIALVAHDKKKEKMIEFVNNWQEYLSEHNIWCTKTTGTLINENTKLNVHCLNSGPLGGDQEIGSMIAKGELELIIFFRDPLTAQPHEPDVSALIRLSDVYAIPTATNFTSASLIMKALTSS